MPLVLRGSVNGVGPNPRELSENDPTVGNCPSAGTVSPLAPAEPVAAAGAEPKTVMIDATYLKAHRTASSLRVKRMARPVGKRFVSDALSSLRKRIRPSNTRSLAKMEIRASWSS